MIRQKIFKMFPDIEPRPYQTEAWDALLNARKKGAKSGLICLATGLGKTTVAAVDALRFVEALPSGRILFVSHMNDLSHQAEVSFKQLRPDLTTMILRGQQRISSETVVFTTFQALGMRLDDMPPQMFDYIIYDEAHHSVAESFVTVARHFKPQFMLGITATPYRRDERDIAVLFGEPLYVKKLPDAIAEGWLAQIDYSIRFDEAVKEAIDNGFQPKSIAEFKRLLKNKHRNDLIAREIKSEQKHIGKDTAKTIVFCDTIKTALEMAGLLGGVAYFAGLSTIRKTAIMQDFRSGKIRTICVRDMFNEGIDIPDARLLVFMRSTASRTIFEQQLGRGLRKTPNKSVVTVLDFVANFKRLVYLRNINQELDQSYLRNSLGQFSGEVSTARSWKFEERTSFVFSKEVHNALALYDQESQATPIPGDHIGVREARITLGTSYQGMLRLLEDNNIQIHMRKNGSGALTRTITRPDFERARRIYTEKYSMVSDADVEGYSLSKLYRRYSLDFQVLKKMLADMGIKTTRVINNYKTTSDIVSQEDVDYLDSLLLVPSGYISINQAAKEVGHAHETTYKAAKKLKLHIFERKQLQKIRYFINQKDLPKIRAFFTVPSGFASCSDVAKLCGVSRPSVGNAARAGEIGSVTVLDTPYYSMAQAKEYFHHRWWPKKHISKEHLLDTYHKSKNVNQTAAALGISWNAVHKRLRKAGVL